MIIYAKLWYVWIDWGDEGDQAYEKRIEASLMKPSERWKMCFFHGCLNIRIETYNFDKLRITTV